jgi:ferredoxin-NADP reductase
MAKLKLTKSYDEAGNIRTFVFETGGAAWTPGQFQVYDLDQVEGDQDAKERYFTIASAPSENEVHISTRISDSDFKQMLNKLQPGDEIEAHDVDGDFTWDNDDEVVLVAGGIGVTPYRSFFVERDRTGGKIPAHMLYFGRDENFAFKDEFDEIAKNHPELKIDYIVGEQISADNILNHAPEGNDKTVFISGPEPMVDAVGEDLKAKNINLKQDWFPGYDETSY